MHERNEIRRRAESDTDMHYFSVVLDNEASTVHYLLTVCANSGLSEFMQCLIRFQVYKHHIHRYVSLPKCKYGTMAICGIKAKDRLE